MPLFLLAPLALTPVAASSQEKAPTPSLASQIAPAPQPPPAPQDVSAAKSDVMATINALFAAMETHDAEAAGRTLHPDATLVVVKEDGSVAMRKGVDFLTSIAKATEPLREGSWDEQVLIDGPMAQVWGAYDFHVGETFSHCGVNSISLARGATGWQIVGVAYTMRKSNCPARPTQ